jgi:quercetin dioxygenase-like cupin family protein
MCSLDRADPPPRLIVTCVGRWSTEGGDAMKKTWLLSLSVAVLLAVPGMAADPAPMRPADPAMKAAEPAMKPVEAKMKAQEGMVMSAEHVMMAPGDMKWAPAPPVLPPGAKIAVLKGDPSQETMFVMRAWMPAGYYIAPHWHPSFENVTVISGEANFGMGDTCDRSKGHKVPTGGFASMPPQVRHCFWTEQETILQLNGMGPQQFYYVNPADDPRNMGKQ